MEDHGMDPKMTIREYTRSHREVILQLFRLNTPRYFSITEESDFIDYLENHAGHFFIVESRGVIAGCGGYNLFPEQADARISWDIFHPDFQGRGLGSALVRFRVDKLKAVPGIKTITVRTSQLVYPFYQKFGFELKEVVKDYWAVGFDLYRMVLEIRTS